MQSILKNKNGQFKDLSCLQVACEMKNLSLEVIQAVKDANIISGLKNLSAQAQRDLMYTNPKFITIINSL